MNCAQCGAMLTGRQRKFCSIKCKHSWFTANDRSTFICSDCGVSYTRERWSKRKTSLCRSCALSRVSRSKDQGGEKNPAWRGGHLYWRQGKLGRDSQGLSWKVQRQLCWVRDSYTCQFPGCGKHKDGWRPDCHHIKPYRLLPSHALDNLISYCRSHHKQIEAQIKELWGGEVFGVFSVRKHIPRCKNCGRRRKLEGGVCTVCVRENYLIPMVVELRRSGLDYRAIAKVMRVTQPTVWRWFQLRAHSSVG